MAPPRKPKSKYIFAILRVCVVLAGLSWGILWLRQGDRFAALVQVLRKMNLWIFAAVLGVFILSQLIIALRWWLLLRAQSVFIKYWTAVRLFLMGWFYNNFMPGSVGGDFVRAWYVTRHTDKKFQAALSVFVDRAIGLFTTLLIAVFCYGIFLSGRQPIISYSPKEGLLGGVFTHKWLVAAVAAAVAALLAVTVLYRPANPRLAKLFSSIRTPVITVFAKFKNAAVMYFTSSGTILVAVAMTVFLQITVITAFWFLGMSMGIDAGVKYYYVFFTLTWVLGPVPVSIGGAVVVEAALVWLFTNVAGVAAEAALALALCQRIVWMLASLPGAAIHLIGAHLPKDDAQIPALNNFSIDCSESIN